MPQKPLKPIDEVHAEMQELASSLLDDIPGDRRFETDEQHSCESTGEPGDGKPVRQDYNVHVTATPETVNNLQNVLLPRLEKEGWRLERYVDKPDEVQLSGEREDGTLIGLGWNPTGSGDIVVGITSPCAAPSAEPSN
ncbi:hypothetical protein [Saccharopolyspora sp. NPDC002376]